MGFQYFVNLGCDPKRTFGRGDIVVGTEAILGRLKCRAQASSVAQMAAKSGTSLEGLTFKSICKQALKDLNLTGAPVQAWRRANLFQKAGPLTHVWKKGLFSNDTVNTNQLLQATMCGANLAPQHCAAILMWLGALALETGVISNTADALAVLKAPPRERAQALRLNLGPATSDPFALLMQRFIRAICHSFILDVPLLLSA